MVANEGIDNNKKEILAFITKYQNVLLIVAWLGVMAFLVYAFLNLHAVITDPCQYCMDHTPYQCYPSFQNFAQQYAR